MHGELLEAERVRSIVAAFFIVFNYFGGGGVCEAAYAGALEYELTLRGHKVDREVLVQVYYKSQLVAQQRPDHSSSAISARPSSRSACCSTLVHTQSSIASSTQ